MSLQNFLTRRNGIITGIVTMVAIAVMIQGCSSTSKGYERPSTPGSSAEIASNTQGITENAATIDGAARDSKLLAQGIKSVSTDPTINANSDGIISNSVTIIDSAEQIRQATVNLEAANANIIELEKRIDELQDNNEKLKSDAIKKLHSIIAVMFGLSMVLIVGGAVLMFLVPTSKSLGILLVASGFICLSVSVGATYYLQQIAQIGLGVLVITILGTVSYVIYSLVNKNGIFLRANKETILLVEEIKKVLPEEVKAEIFGPNSNRVVDRIQSKETQDLVKYLKKEIDD